MSRKTIWLAFLLTWIFHFTQPVSLAAQNILAADQNTPAPLAPDLDGQQTLAAQIPAHNNDIRFQHLSIDQGLSQSSVHCILQDDQGFLWFGTEDGLNRYDGYDFTIYRQDPGNPDSLSSNTVLRLLQDKEGYLWIGTVGGGLDRLDRTTGKFAHFRHDPQNPQSIASDDINALFQDREGNLWIGTPVGLDLWDSQSDNFTHFTHNPSDLNSLASNGISVIYQDFQGNLWIGSDSGLDQFASKTRQFMHFPLEPISPNSRYYITSITEDPAGNLWLGTQSGLIYLDPITGDHTNITHDSSDPGSLNDNNVTTVLIDSTGILWVGTRGKGVDRLDPSSDKFIHYSHNPLIPASLSANNISAILEDRSGLLWFGAIGGGINKHNPRASYFASYTADQLIASSLTNDDPMGMDVSPRGEIWISTLGGGLNILDPKTGRTFAYRFYSYRPDSLSSDEARDVYFDSQGQAWIGTSYGLNLWNSNGSFTTYVHNPDDEYSLSNNVIYAITEDLDGNLWVGTNNGLNKSPDAKNGKFTRYLNQPQQHNSLSYNVIWSLYVDRSGTLWIGTRGGGLNRYNPQTDDFTVYRHNPQDTHSLSNNIITTIFEDRSGNLWVGTYGGGLNIFDHSTQTFTAITQNDGLPSNVIYGILEDAKGFLWLSTNYGISRFDPLGKAFLNITKENGLPTNEFNLNSFCQTTDGQIYFGGSGGLVAFNPQQLTPNPFIPPVVITAVSLFNKVEQTYLPNDKQLQFNYRQNFMSFDFAALDFTAPEKNRYAYILEGLDQDWVEAGLRRHADYPNLKPGHYTFRVRGSNNDGVWNETGVSVSITITPPFWGTPAFQASILIFLLGIIFVSYRLRVQSIESRSQHLEQQVAERTRELGALNAIAEVTNSSLDLKEILHGALSKTLEVLEIEAGGIYLLQESDQALHLAVHQGLSAATVEPIGQLKMGEGFSGTAAQTAKPVIVWDIASDSRLANNQAAKEGFRSLASFPLVSRSRVSGSLFVITRNQRQFTQQNIDLLTAIGRQLGSAIENAHLFDTELRRAEQFRLIVDVGRGISPIMDIEQALHEITQQIHVDFGYYHVGIGLVEGDEVVYRVGAGDLWDGPDFNFKPSRLKVGVEGITGCVAGSGKTLLVPDVSQEKRYIEMVGSQTRSELAVPIIVKEKVIGVLDVQSNKLNDFDDIDLAVLQTLANLAGTAIENSQRFTAEQRRAEQFRVINEVSQQVASIFELDELLKQMASMIQEGFNYYHVGIGLIEEGEVVSKAEVGKCNYPQDLRVKLGQGVWGKVAQTGELHLSPDVLTDDFYIQEHCSQYVRSILCVPLTAKDTVVGVLSAESNLPNFFDQSDVIILQSLAHQAAVAIENTLLFADAQRLAVIDERSRLARELHDSVTQSLYGVTLYAQAASGQLALNNPQRAREHLNELQDTAQEALAEMRLLIYELRPSMLAEEGLAAALQTRLMAVEERTGLKTEFKAQLPARLPAFLEAGLYRIAQEALNNALRHAHAQKIMVYLHQEKTTVGLEICDDGTGFDPAIAQKRGGMGICTMQERAAEINGHWSIESQPGAGTRVCVEVEL